MITNIDIVNEELSMKLRIEGETDVGEATSSISPSVQESSIGNSMLEEEQIEGDSGSDHQTEIDSALEIFPMTKNEALALLRSNVVAVQTLEHITAQLNRTMEEIKEERKSFREEREFYVEERRVLQEQMRDMNLKLLKAELTTNNESQSLRLNYQLPNGTPQKLERLPLTETTPKSTNADDNNRHSFPRRKLSYVKSRDLLAERSEDEDCSSPPQQADSIQAPVPKLSLVEVKQEQDISNNSSPLRNGLLALANAALNCTYADEKSSLSPKSDSTLTTDDDSGRSSEGSSGDSSPPAGVMASGKFVRYEVLNSSFPHHHHPHNDLRHVKHAFVSASESEMKARKRKKNKQPLPCNFCGKCFNNQSSLRQHESFHRPLRPFKCESENCDKAYKTRSELNRHKIVHDGQKRHECKLCGKRFLRKQYLKTHLLRHHETGLALLMPSAMENFKNDTTGSIPSIVVSSSFVSKTEPLTWRCQMCFGIFVSEEDLSRHVRSYHDKKKLSEVRYDFHSHHDRAEMMETPAF